MHVNTVEFVGTPVIRRCLKVTFTFHRQFRMAEMVEQINVTILAQMQNPVFLILYFNKKEKYLCCCLAGTDLWATDNFAKENESSVPGNNFTAIW